MYAARRRTARGVGVTQVLAGRSGSYRFRFPPRKLAGSPRSHLARLCLSAETHLSLCCSVLMAARSDVRRRGCLLSLWKDDNWHIPAAGFSCSYCWNLHIVKPNFSKSELNFFPPALSSCNMQLQIKCIALKRFTSIMFQKVSFFADWPDYCSSFVCKHLSFCAFYENAISPMSSVQCSPRGGFLWIHNNG